MRKRIWMMKKRGWLLARGWYLSKKCRPEEGAGIWQNHRGNLTPQPTATPRAGPPTTHDVSRPFSTQLGHPGTCAHSQRILLRPLHRLQALREPHFFGRPGPMTRFCPTKLWLVAVDSDKIRLLPPQPSRQAQKGQSRPSPTVRSFKKLLVATRRCSLSLTFQSLNALQACTARRTQRGAVRLQRCLPVYRLLPVGIASSVLRSDLMTNLVASLTNSDAFRWNFHVVKFYPRSLASTTLLLLPSVNLFFTRTMGS